MASPRTTKARVRIREVPYKVIRQDALGGEMIQYETAYGPGWPGNFPSERMATNPDLDGAVAEEEYRLGQVIELMDDDYMRLKGAGAVVDVDDETTERLEEEKQRQDEGFGGKSDAELEAWIRDEKPTVNEVVEASDGDADLAQRLLEAETRAQDGDARKGVVEGLMHVIAQA